MAGITAELNQRLENEKIIWLATVQPDGHPHLVPIWFIWLDGHVYVCTEGTSVKIRNITVNPNVCFSLEDGNKPLIGKGIARLLHQPFASRVTDAFKAKYDWDINIESSYSSLIEITPLKWLSW